MTNELTGSPAHAAQAMALPQGAHAFQRMLQMHLPRLSRVCGTLERNRDDAAELLQEAMVLAWQHRADYDGSGSIFGWLYRIVQNQHVTRVRRLARRRTLWSGLAHTLDELWDSVHRVDAAGEFLEKLHDERELLACLHELAEPFRMAVQLCDIEELDYAQAAEVLGVPIGTVKSRHARGRAKLSQAVLARRGHVGGADGDVGRGKAA